MRPTDETMQPVTFRLPAAFVAQLRAEVKASGRTLSDVLRSHLTDRSVKPLNLARPRKRPPLKAPKRADSRFLAGLWLVYRSVERFRVDLAYRTGEANLGAVARIEVRLTAVMSILDELRQLAPVLPC